MPTELQDAACKAQPANGSLSSRAVGSVLTVALLARLLVLLSLVQHSATTWIFQRGLETGFVAHALLSHQGFASPFGGNTGPTALISPGYVLLVAAVFRIFGESTSASACVILLTQILIGVATVWAVMALAERLAGRPAALVAGIFFAVWPTFLWVPTIFWDTSLTLFLLPALLLLALHVRQQPSRGTWLALGALCGLAVLINLALSIVVAAVFCWCVFNARKRTADVLLAAVLALLIYAPWPLRNARTLHAFIPLRTTVGLELWMGNREGATGFLDDSVFPYYNRAELAAYVRQGEVGYMRSKSAAAESAIRQHPGTFVVLTGKRLVRFWFGTGTRGGSRCYALGATLTTLGGLGGLFRLFSGERRARSTALLFALPLLLFPLPYYITHAEFRYRLALEPLLVPLGASLIASLVAASASRSAHDTHNGRSKPKAAEQPVHA